MNAPLTVTNQAPAERKYGTSIQIPKAAEIVSASLRNQIIRGEIVTGQSLPSESVLMQQFGISRPTLREAVRILESEHLVTVRRGARGGAVVHEPSSDLAARHAALVLQFRGATLADIYQAREIFEPACVRMVAEKCTQEHIELLRAVLENEQLGEQEVHDLSKKVGFHRTLVQLSGNQTLILISDLLRDIMLKAAVKEHQLSVDHGSALKQHAEVIGLLEHHEGEAAQELWSKHLKRTTERVLKQLGGSTTVLDVLS
ncbi:FCD domain-containing protein [Arthrobacter sp. NPDC080031]|uniref:FadR/GntR family transcriptional regulator n=1 Tax=Arthrobacter sp. NPDC080031 TaxID=3155918 RepID=UPI00344D524C